MVSEMKKDSRCTCKHMRSCHADIVFFSMVGLGVGRCLVSGCDCWRFTWTRPVEDRSHGRSKGTSRHVQSLLAETPGS
jgi:hypothetical protein